MPHVPCKICGKEFYARPSHLNHGWAKYCSTICRNESQKRGKFFRCAMLGRSWRNGILGPSYYRRKIEAAGIRAECIMCHKNDRRILLVHHIDQSRENNSLENLAWLCYNCHYLVHKHQVSLPEKEVVPIA